MILIAGIASEAPVALAIAASEEAGIEHVVFDQRDVTRSDIELNFDPAAGWSGTLSWGAERVDLDRLAGIYVRLMDEAILPDVAALDPESPERIRVREIGTLLHAWFDVARARVANRPRAMMSNMSKTYQAAAVRAAGFRTPESLVANDPERVLAFVDACAADGDEVIYKSVSGTRSVVQTFRDADRDRLGRIRWCPTMFQRRIRGTDVRVHVVGRSAFATRIASDATDYRYAVQQIGTDAELSPARLPAKVERACIALAHGLGLPFAGIDLRETPDGDWYCFEANPCPAYSYYQRRTGAPIARALVTWLATGDASG